MKFILCFIVILGSVILGICNAVPVNSNEEEARKYAQDISEQMLDYYNTLSKFILRDKGSENIKNLARESDTLSKKAKALNVTVSDVKQFDDTKFKDKELRYIFRQLKKSFRKPVLRSAQSDRISFAIVTLEEIFTAKDIKGYKNKNDKLAYSPDVQSIFATSSDSEELKYYWNALSEKNEKSAVKHFSTLYESIRDAASEMKIPAYEFWMNDYNMTEMDDVMNQIEPFYKQLHAFLRNQLRKKYGDSVIKSDGLIPDHLFQQAQSQSWTNKSVFDDYFPYSDLPPYDLILKQKNFDAMKIFRTADKLYESMGFDAIPESYWGKSLKTNEPEDGVECKVKIKDWFSNVYMQFCQKMDFRTFLQAHGYMAEIHYALEKNHLPSYYFDSYDLEHAVGEAVILSASSQKHLNTVGIVTDFEFTEQVLMNRLMRLNVDTMLNIPVYYVHTKLMADLLMGKIEMTDMNKHYWELMENYVGVGPPSGDRDLNTFDLSPQFYLEINTNGQSKKFHSKVLSYQLYVKLCSISEQYLKGQLQNCDFYGSKVAGDALKKMMKLGSSKTFHEVLAAMLPESPKLNAESVIEYFSPVFSWMEGSNKKNSVHIGWTNSDKNIAN